MENINKKTSMKICTVQGKIYWVRSSKLKERLINEFKVSTIEELALGGIANILEQCDPKSRDKSKTASRVKHYLLDDNDDTVGQNTIKTLGKYLEEDEMAFFEEFNDDSILQRALELSNWKNIQNIFNLIFNIIDEYEVSESYNCKPETTENGFDYYHKKLDDIKSAIYRCFLTEENIKAKLINIVNETEVFVKSYSIPGVVERWRVINKQIGYFDIVYDILEADKKIFSEICNGKYKMGSVPLSFSFIPSEEEIMNRNEYFKIIEDEIDKNNLRYSKDYIFKKELRNTLELVFKNDFPEYFN